ADAPAIRRRVPTDGSRDCIADTVGCARRAVAETLVVSPAGPPTPAGGSRQQLAEERDRPVCIGAARAGRTYPFTGSRPADAYPARLFRFDGAAADPGGSRGVCARLLAERL